MRSGQIMQVRWPGRIHVYGFQNRTGQLSSPASRKVAARRSEYTEDDLRKTARILPNIPKLQAFRIANHRLSPGTPVNPFVAYDE